MKIKQSLLKYISKDSPRQMRYNCAKGLMELPPHDKMCVLYVLGFDKDEQVAKEASSTLVSMSKDDVHHALGAPMDKGMLDKAVFLFGSDPEALRQILMNKNTGLETLKKLAATGPMEVVKGIMESPPRIKDNNEVRHAFIKNPLAAPFYEKMKPTEESAAEKEASHKAHLDKVHAEEAEWKKKAAEEAAAKKKAAGEAKKAKADGAQAGEEGEPEVNPADDESLPMATRLKYMTIGQKIKVAQTGDKEVRGILIKEANKQISTSVLKNPRMTDNEAMKLAVTKGTIEELLRIIAGKKEWMKIYAIKCALATNPKTPVPISMKILNVLYDKDLEKISRSKGIPSVIAQTAKKVYQARKKR